MTGDGGCSIASGSLTPGIRAEDFGLPAHTALRMDLPAPALRDVISDYHVFDSCPVRHSLRSHVILPSWPVIRLSFSTQRISLSIGPREYRPVPPAALYGTITRAQRLTSHGGVMIGAGITPMGWSRLFRMPASDLRDRAVPLDRIWPGAEVQALYDRLATSDRAQDVPGILDDFFLRHVREPGRDEPQIRRFVDLLRQDTEYDLPAAAAHVGVTPVTLRRLSTRYFGFPPKILMIRARFLRSIVRMMMAGTGTPDYSLMSPAYFDIPHFLRDADRFLGMTPRRLLEHDNSYLLATLRARYAVTQASRADRATYGHARTPQAASG